MVIIAVALIAPWYLHSSLESVDLLICAGKRIRNPLWSFFGVMHTVIALPPARSLRHNSTSPVMVLVHIPGNTAVDVVAPQRPSMDAFGWNTCYNSISLYAPRRAENGTVIRLFPLDAHAGFLVLPELGESSLEASCLRIEVGVYRNYVVTRLNLERNSKLDPGSIAMKPTVAHPTLSCNLRPFLVVDPIGQWVPD